MTQITTKNSSTGAAVPVTGDLVQGELAVNVADKKLYTKDAGGAIVELGINPTTIDINAGTIDGTTIGATTPSTGVFTNVTGTLLTAAQPNITSLGTITSLVATTADINGGTVDAVIGGTTPAAGTFTTLGGTLSTAAQPNITSVGTITSLVATTADINGGTVDGTVIGGTTTAAISGTTGQFSTSLNVDGTATLDGLTVAGNDFNPTSNTPSFPSLFTGSYGGGLHFEDTNYAGMYVQSSGELLKFYVGKSTIETAQDNVKLQVNATGIDVTGTATMDGLTVSNGTNTTAIPATSDRLSFTAGSSFIQGTGALFVQPAGDLVLNGTGAEIMRLKSGKVGINNSNPATALDVTGTATMDGLTTNGAAEGDTYFTGGTASSRVLNVFTSTHDGGANAGHNFKIASGQGAFIFGNNTTANLLTVKSGGIDVTGTATMDGLVVDGASTFNAQALFLNNTEIRFKDSVGTERTTLTLDASNDLNLGTSAGGNLKFFNGSSYTERMRIDASGNVGIGTDSPTANMEISSASNPELSIASTGGSTSNFLNFKAISHTQQTQTQLKTIDNGDFTADLAFLFKGTGTGGALSEKMRIDSSGNVLVGHTSAEGDASGTTLYQNGQTVHKADGAYALELRRSTSDGDIALFKKDSLTVGSIGSYAGSLDVAGSTRGVRITDGAFFPVTNAGSVSDNYVNLGYSGGRFKDLYLSSGVYLGGTGAANKLDDYEEGTWTPSLVGSSTAGTATFVSGPTGTYTKIGNTVNINFSWNISAHTGSGALRVNGLPFTSTGAPIGVVMVGNYAYPAGKTNFVAFGVGAVLRFYGTGDGVGYTENTLDVAHQINGSLTYTV